MAAFTSHVFIRKISLLKWARSALNSLIHGYCRTRRRLCLRKACRATSAHREKETFIFSTGFIVGLLPRNYGLKNIQQRNSTISRALILSNRSKTPNRMTLSRTLLKSGHWDLFNIDSWLLCNSRRIFSAVYSPCLLILLRNFL